MFKKINNKILIVVLLALVAIYFISENMDSSDRSFNKDVLSIDTAAINRLEMYSDMHGMVALQKPNKEWMVVIEGEQQLADQAMVNNLLATLAALSPTRVATTKKEKFGFYEVTDSNAVIVKMFNENDLLQELYIGKFSYIMPEGQQQQTNPYQQPQGRMISYVRVANENEVYAVDGYLKMNFTYDNKSYRDKRVCVVDGRNITRVSVSGPEESYVLSRVAPGYWNLDGQPADSIGVDAFLSKVSRTSSRDFYDEPFDINQTPSHTFIVEGDNFAPVTVKAYPADSIHNYVISSSMNKGAVFHAKGSLHSRIWKPKSNFVPKEN